MKINRGDNMFNKDIKFRILPKHFKCLDIADQQLHKIYDQDQLRLNASEITNIVKIIIDEYFTTDKIIDELNAYLRECETYTRYKLINHEIVLVEYDSRKVFSPRFKVQINGCNPKFIDEIKSVTPITAKKLQKTFYNLAFTWLYTRVQMHMKDIIFKKCLNVNTKKKLNMMNDQWIIKGSYDELVDTYLIFSKQL